MSRCDVHVCATAHAGIYLPHYVQILKRQGLGRHRPTRSTPAHERTRLGPGTFRRYTSSGLLESTSMATIVLAAARVLTPRAMTCTGFGDRCKASKIYYNDRMRNSRSPQRNTASGHKKADTGYANTLSQTVLCVTAMGRRRYPTNTPCT